MNTKLQRLAERRQRLIERAAYQRDALSQDVEPWRTALAQVDRGVAALRYMKRHPLWIAGSAGLLVYLIGPGRVWQWLGRGVVAWRTLYQFRIR